MNSERNTGSTPRRTTRQTTPQGARQTTRRTVGQTTSSTPRQRTRTSASRQQGTAGRATATTTGAHSRQGARQRSEHMNAQSVNFSNTRRGKRAARGEVSNVGGAGLTQGAVRSHQPHFSNKKSFAHGIQRTARIKRLLLILLAALVVVGVGVGVGMLVFYGGLSSKFSLSSQDRPTSLATQSNGSSYYVLVSADLDTSDGCDTDVDSLALVHVDSDSKKLALVSVPTSVAVKMSDGSAHAIREAVSVGGYTELVSAVSSLTGVQVSHFVKTDEAGIRGVVTSMGGLTLHLSEEVDDPNAGYIYIPAGQQTLDADQAMTFLRAKNYRNGKTTMEENQTLVIAMVVEYLSQGSQADTSSRLDAIAGCFQADLSGQDLTSAFRSMSGFKASDAYRDSIPSYATSTKDDAVYAVYEDSMKKLFSNIESGNYTGGTEGSLANINPAAYTVTVRNGSGITGGATTIANILSGVGFQVTETGNADSFVYNETLVIYGNDSLKEAAQAAAGVLGVGRATEAGVYYTYDTDLLVILGSDWKPTS